MNVSLTPELEALVDEKVQSGDYNSASEVVRAALRLLKEQDDFRRAKITELRGEIQVADEKLERGEYKVYDSVGAFFEELKQDVHDELAAEQARVKRVIVAAAAASDLRTISIYIGR
jgi:antitoxin ParD1/3/4